MGRYSQGHLDPIRHLHDPPPLLPDRVLCAADVAGDCVFGGGGLATDGRTVDLGVVGGDETLFSNHFCGDANLRDYEQPRSLVLLHRPATQLPDIFHRKTGHNIRI